MSRGSILLVCTALCFPAWAYGGAETWAIVVLAGLGVSAVCLGHSRFRSTPVRRLVMCCWPMVLLGFYMLVQALNPSHEYRPMDQGLTPCSHLSWLPSSVAAGLTWRSLLLFAAVVLVWGLLRFGVPGRMIPVAIAAVIISASLMAVLALVQGGEHEPWDLVGRFLNENSYAAYANLVFPVALGAARSMHARARREHQRSDPSLLLYFLSALLAVSVLLCGSRAGAMVAVLIMVAWILAEWLSSKGRRSRLQFCFRAICLVVVVVSLLFLFGPERLVEAALDLRQYIVPDSVARFSAAYGAWRMFLARPLFGIGAGAFQAAFPYFRAEGLYGFYRHAHNDWVQWLAELGVLGSSIAVAALVTVWPRRDRLVHHGPSRWIRLGMWIGLAGVSLHACIDFPFRIPGIAVLVAAWVGMLGRHDRLR
jgi:O-antigen ligase